jgi:hypothetical protein
LDIHRAFRYGAEQLVHAQYEYTELHKGHGIDEFQWKVLTQDEYWTPNQARDMRAVLANVLEVSLTIAGMPAIPLPGQYIAALIAIVVKPANRIVACSKSPDTYDAVKASGLLDEVVVEPMRVEQLISLVMAYSGGVGAEPQATKLPAEVGQAMKKHSKR